MDTRDKVTICKVVAQAILSDAQVTDRERQFLEKLMTGFELDRAQRKEVLARNLGDDPGAMVEGMTDGEAKKTLLREVARAVATDGVYAAEEEKLLERLGAVLGIGAAEIEALIGDAIE
jgi:tellurite resistance protein